jgi:hypothetical protein
MKHGTDPRTTRTGARAHARRREPGLIFLGRKAPLSHPFVAKRNDPGPGIASPVGGAGPWGS